MRFRNALLFSIPFGAIVVPGELSEKFDARSIRRSPPGQANNARFVQGYVFYADIAGNEFLTGFFFRLAGDGRYRLPMSDEETGDDYNYYRELGRKRLRSREARAVRPFRL